MKVIYGPRGIRRLPKKSIVTIGVFDGVHIGHRRIIKKVVKKAKYLGASSVVVTFDPHPLYVVHPTARPPRIMSLQHKLEILKELGIDICLVIRFSKKFSSLRNEGFVKRILVDKLNTSKVIIGENFKFGKDKKGTLKALLRLGEKYSFSVEGLKAVRKKGRIVSSSLIRELISRGDLRGASRLLERPVSVLGTVVGGHGRGRIIGFPTANIDPHHEVIPPSGVYAVKIRLQNRMFNGILNIGKCPTFKSKTDVEPTIEVHIFNFNKNIYGKNIEILFMKAIRKEKCFSSKEDLNRQIKRDVKLTKRYL
jgi:riboflavin kinase/FMN adenylyltransferase